MLIQPLIICMVGGFVLVNFSASRATLLALLEGSSHVVYVAFFTYSGCTLDVSALPDAMGLASLVSLARLVGILAGTQLGIRASRMPRAWTRYAWMAFLTQAGVALGLGAQVSATFAWGDDFYTSVVACVVITPIRLAFASLVESFAGPVTRSSSASRRSSKIRNRFQADS